MAKQCHSCSRADGLDGDGYCPDCRLGDETPAHAATLHALTGLGVPGPGGVYKPDAEEAPEGQTCARCGRPGMWISGAGLVLCVRHQDDY